MSMRKLLILPIILLITLASCKKQSSTFIGTITATIDDTPFVFSLQQNSALVTTTVVDPSTTRYEVSVYGYTKDTSRFVELNVIALNQPVTAGTYIDTVSSPYTSNLLYDLGTSNALLYSSVGTNTSYSTINISSISSTSVQGTFSGVVTLVNPGTSTVVSHTVTDGQFNVPIIRLTN
jgi:hypothetical protein